MIDTESIPNWRRWDAKEESGVNRGYTQAYINESRGDHFVCISTRNSDYDDEFRVVMKCGTDGNWKSSGESAETFDGQESEADSLLAQTEDAAREWMLDHPCERDGTRDAVELLTDIFTAFREAGLEPQHDMTLNGFTRPGHADSTSHDIRPFVLDDAEEQMQGADDPSDAEILQFGVGVDGKASGVSFREYTERNSSGDMMHNHEPTNQDVLHADIESAFESVGFEEIHVKNGGYQTHWDYTTRYTIRVFVPDGFELAFPEDSKSRQRTSFF